MAAIKLIIFDHFIVFHKNNTHMTILVMSLKYDYSRRFQYERFQKFEISMLTAVKTSDINAIEKCYVLTTFSIEISAF